MLQAITKTSLSLEAPLRRGDQLCHFVPPFQKLRLVQLMLLLLGMGKGLRLALPPGFI